MKYAWHREHIYTNEDADRMMKQFIRSQPRVGGFDTETTGLHIIYDKPFIVQWGFIDEQTQTGYAYAVDLEQQPILARQVIAAWLKASESLEWLIAHNTKFDLHQLLNIGFAYTKENVTDTMFYIRYGHDALQVEKGGPPLDLKGYAFRYVTPNARHHERELDQEKTAIASRLNNELFKVFLKGRTKKSLEPFFNDHCNDPEELPPEVWAGYKAWLDWLPPWIKGRFHNLIDHDDIPYTQLNRVNVIKYAIEDIVLLLETFAQLEPVVAKRKNNAAIAFENKLIFPLLEMERTGFNTDFDYLRTCKQNLKNYIRERRKHLHELVGHPVSANQNQKIQDAINARGIVCQSTKADVLRQMESHLRHTGEDPVCADLIRTVTELRTLEKWYSTYILRFLRYQTVDNRLYTTINQVGTVSGRVTSDFQQFPKDSIQDAQGRVLFNPRQMVRVDGGDYHGTVYLDYSQIELRVQAMYTILVGHPEPNLCRAYMPYNCIDEHGNAFSERSALDHRDIGNHTWFLMEAPQTRWEPVDVHGATTQFAFDVTPDDPNYKHLRYLGKRVNFAKNYGAQEKRIREMFPEYDDARIKQINEAYYKAFPGVKSYHDYCDRLARSSPYAENLFGIRYYNVSGHNLINMLIQGSSAFFLKQKIREIYEYSKTHKLKSKFQMNIHDELSWCKHKDEGPEFFEIKKIMEDWDGTLVPIVAEMEVTYATWADKKAVKSIDDLRCNHE